MFWFLPIILRGRDGDADLRCNRAAADEGAANNVGIGMVIFGDCRALAQLLVTTLMIDGPTLMSLTSSQLFVLPASITQTINETTIKTNPWQYKKQNFWIVIKSLASWFLKRGLQRTIHVFYRQRCNCSNKGFVLFFPFATPL